jgi:PAS domain S-box-containing protein
MLDYLSSLLQMLIAPGLPPHGFCLLWQPELIWLHGVSDAVIGTSYFIIPLALAYFVRKHKDLAFGRIFWMFAAFILACGTTHFVEVLTLWYPAYGVQGLIKAVTAITSLVTAAMLWPLVMRALAFPTPAELRHVSDELVTRGDERDDALRTLKRAEESFRRLVEGVTDYAIFMLDAEGNVSTWNKGAERIKGYQRDEILGEHFSIFYTPEDRAAGIPTQALAAVNREGRYESERWRVRKDGSRFWASVVIDPLRDENERIIGYAKVTRDITNRKETELALEQTRAILAQTQKMETIGQLAGGIAHDFNNLLTAIMGGVSLLERRIGHKIGQEPKKILSAIGDAARRAAKLTQQLLAFSRKQTLAPRITDANKLITGMSELLSPTLGEKVALETVLAVGLWNTNVDQNQLENAVLNLAVNARDAMPDGGRLTLETANVYLDENYARREEMKPGQYVLVAVTDTGAGMDQEVRNKAFEPFFTTKPPGTSTGLGLSQVFGFVKQSDGHIKLYSEVGHGTTVKIYLPRYLEKGEPEETRDARLDEVPGGSETVLVVEDHDSVREHVVDALLDVGYTVLEVANGKDALEVVAGNPNIALLLTDVGLPGMNGRQLADEAKRLNPKIRVLYMTGYARNAISHNGLLDAGVSLLPKPFTVGGLARKVREVLDT